MISQFFRESAVRIQNWKYARILGKPLLLFTTPKIISALDGGLGSQMRQFALGYCVSRHTSLPLYLDTHFFLDGTDLLGKKNRFFLLLETFPEIKKRYSREIRSLYGELIIRVFFSDRYVKRKRHEFSLDILTKEPHFIAQWYDNVHYFKGYEDDLRALFRFKIELSEEEKAIRERMRESPNSCTIHIRKGDYVGTVHDVCTDEYYLQATRKVLERYPDACFFIFSNDEKYARNLFAGMSAKISFVESRCEEDPRVDMYLLTQSKHSIIANSNFSWMGAFLREYQEGMTLMPSAWHRYPDGSVLESDCYNISGWEYVEV